MSHPLPEKYFTHRAMELKWQDLWDRITLPGDSTGGEVQKPDHIGEAVRSDILCRYRLMRRAVPSPYPGAIPGKTRPSHRSGRRWGILEEYQHFPDGGGTLESMLEEYGADVLRFSMAGSPDKPPSPSRLKGSASLIQKIWHAFRYASLHLKGDESVIPDPQAATDADRWFLNHLNNQTARIDELFDQESISGAAANLEKLIRRDFCGWYLEFIRKEMDRAGTRCCLLYALLHLVHLIHPLMPHVSEEIHSQLTRQNQPSLLQLPYPEFRSELVFFRSFQDVEALRRLIRATRSCRRFVHLEILQGSTIALQGNGSPSAQWLRSNQDYFLGLTGAVALDIQGDPPAAGFRGEAGNWSIWIPVKNSILYHRIVKTLRSDGDQLRLRIHRMQRKLNHRDFMETVPSQTAFRWKRQLQQYLHSHEQILRSLATLGKNDITAPAAEKRSRK